MDVSATKLEPASATDLRAQYATLGYLALPALIRREEIAELRQALDEVLAEARGLEKSTRRFLLSTQGGFHVRRVYDCYSAHMAFQRLAAHPRILDALETVLGPNIELHHAKINLKPKTTDSGFAWHQDYAFFPHTNFDFVAVMVALDEASVANGCLTIIPGSHKLGPLRHRFASDGAYSSTISDRQALSDPERWLDLPMAAGDVHIHHCTLLHSSRPNAGDEPRAMVVMHYRAADNLQLVGYTGHHGYGVLLRGNRPRTARLEQGVVPLPDLMVAPPSGR